jgi:TRAP-type mannitol/chloroaromatic compound transport system permease small subunit
MQALLAASRRIDALNRWVGRATAWLILAAVLISTGNAVMRKAFHLGSNAWLESQWYLTGAAFLLCAGYVLLVDEHVRVDALAQRLGPRLRAWFDLLTLLAVVLPLCVLMIVLGGRGFWQALASGEHSFMADGLVIWPVRLMLPLGFSLLGLQALSEAVKRWHFLRGGRDRPSLGEADLPPFLGAVPPDRGR